MAETKSSPVPIRFEQSVRDRLQTVSSGAGLSVSDVCRLAVEQFLTEVEQTGKITLTLAEPVSKYKAASKQSASDKEPPKKKKKAKSKP